MLFLLHLLGGDGHWDSFRPITSFCKTTTARGRPAKYYNLILSCPPAGPTTAHETFGMLGCCRHEGRQLLGAISPILSWTVGPRSTTDCRQSVHWAVEHAY